MVERRKDLGHDDLDSCDGMSGGKRATVLVGDCMEVLRTLDEASVDAVVTDPPYGLSFMGKKWDYDVPSVDIWHEVMQVLKPGGHLLSFGGTRTYHRMVVNIEDAGFEIRDMIVWHYGTGFPKSLDVSKAIDKIAPVDAAKEQEIAQHLRASRESLGLTKNEVDQLVFGGTTRYSFVEGRTDNTGAGRIYLPTPQEWVRLKEVLRLDDRYDAYITAAIPERNLRHTADGGRSNLVQQDEVSYGYRDGERWQGMSRVTEPNADAAKRWSGFGTALKPASEPVVVARKPIEGTVAQNVLKHGTGAINVDGCRIGTSKNVPASPSRTAGVSLSGGSDGSLRRETGDEGGHNPNVGRWPANVVFSHAEGCEEKCVEGCPITELDRQSSEGGMHGAGSRRGGGASVQTNDGGGLFGVGNHDGNGARFGDAGGASRFFYTAKASSDDKAFYCRECKDAYSLDQLKKHAHGKKDKEHISRHPTVKPADLMAWLCRLVTPPGGLILDPFAGTGSTGVAALREGFRCVLVERDPEYAKIAERRLQDDDPLMAFVERKAADKT